MATFSEKMKGFAQSSKELASKAAAKAQDLGEKAGAKAQNLGEQGVLLLEIKKLKGEVEKLTNALGQEAYTAFVVQKQSAVNAADPEFKKILDEIASTQETIGKKEAELQEKKDK
ncbi:MAG: hypothetical protein LBG90_09720 [Spirochaetaceae bacterium]|jgi:hypothetical protein|nr:hypothetical protein [Spirochaetaceae bacterium]